MSDEELGAVGTGARIRHGKYAGAIMLEVRAAFVFKTVAGASHARPGGIAALDHEIRNHAMEFEAVVKAAGSQVQEGSRRHGRLGSEHRQLDVSLGSMDGNILVGCHARMLNAWKGMVKAVLRANRGPVPYWSLPIPFHFPTLVRRDLSRVYAPLYDAVSSPCCGRPFAAFHG